MWDPIPVILENIVNPDVKCDPSSGTSPLAYYQEVPSPGGIVKSLASKSNERSEE